MTAMDRNLALEAVRVTEAAALRDEAVSLAAMIQRGRAPNEAVPVVLTTHETEEGALERALARIEKLDSVVEPPRVIRIIEAL